jgi:hypothetical protein
MWTGPARNFPLLHLAYDILELDGNELRDLPLVERKRGKQVPATFNARSDTVGDEVDVSRRF